MTVGPTHTGDGVINIGVAAHITAASPRGPRYDPSLTREQRRAHENGIWLCQNCGKQVDADDAHFTVETLRHWKRQAEAATLREVSSGRIVLPRALLPLAEDVDGTPLRLAVEPAPGNLEDLVTGFRVSALDDLQTFMAGPTWPSHPVELALALSGAEGELLTAAGLARSIELTEGLTLVAGPGTGKTTTLLQLAEAILARGENVAVFVPLNEWSASNDDFLDLLLRRPSFAGLQRAQLEAAARAGQFVLLLDGWNELDGPSRLRATRDLRRLQRELDGLRIVASTRQQALDVPLSGPTLIVRGLSAAQQGQIARETAGEAGERRLDGARRTPGMRELVSIPLYLKTLLAQTGGEGLATAGDLLRTFVEQHERLPEHAEALRTTLQDCHRPLLIALAHAATKAANTAIPEPRARALVTGVQQELLAAGQLLVPIQPADALDTLVAHHILVRAGQTLSFQHQQFQEWFASFTTEELMLASFAGDRDRAQRLRVEVLNEQVWEEAVLFAGERLGRAGDRELHAVAATIIDLLAIDPMLAGNLIARAPAAWPLVRERVVAFATAWHKPGRIDRAVRFMILTGAGDFADVIWPLVANNDDQVHLAAIRAAPRFRLSVLGADARQRLADLPDETRRSVLIDLAYHSTLDGMELVAEMAAADADPELQIAVIEALEFRASDRLALQVLRQAPPPVWSKLAEGQYSRTFNDPQVIERLEAEERAVRARQLEPQDRLHRILHSSRPQLADAAELKRLLEDPGLPVREREVAPLIDEAVTRYPVEAADALRFRLTSGLELPFLGDELLTLGDSVDDGPIAEMAGNPDVADKQGVTAAMLVGTRTVERMLGILFTLRADLDATERPPDAVRRRYHDFQQRILQTRQSAFLGAWLQRAPAQTEATLISVMAELLARHGASGSPAPAMRTDQATRAALTEACQRLGASLLASASASRAHLAQLAAAIGRVGESQLLPLLLQLLEQDLERWQRAREARLRDRRGRDASSNDAHIVWTHYYGRALRSIGTAEVIEQMKPYLPNPLFGEEAARVMLAIDRAQRGERERPPGFAGPDFTEVAARRSERQRNQTVQSPIGESILAAVDELMQPDAPEAMRRAVALAAVALRMPYEGQERRIAGLVALPLPMHTKYELLSALVHAGEVLDPALLLEGVTSYLEEAQRHPWMLQRDGAYALHRWLELLPFSRSPMVTLEAFERLPPHLREWWRHRNVLSALSQTPDPAAERTLVEWVRREPALLHQHEWLSALLARKTETACRTLLDLVCDPGFAGPAARIDAGWVARTLEELVRLHPALRTELVGWYRDPARAAIHRLIERVLAAVPTYEVLLALIERYVADQRAFDHQLERAVEALVLEHRPVAGAQGMYEVYAAPVVDLRRHLLARTQTGHSEAQLAAACLEAIDELRDRYGRSQQEPRHPDIASGLPWPVLPG